MDQNLSGFEYKPYKDISKNKRSGVNKVRGILVSFFCDLNDFFVPIINRVRFTWIILVGKEIGCGWVKEKRM